MTAAKRTFPACAGTGQATAAGRREIEGTIGLLGTIAAMEIKTKVLRDDGASRIIRQWSPLGVVAAITPWNFPMLLLMMKLGPGLSAGNASHNAAPG